ncbi:hypothetical protein [Plantactinospora sp. CA-290183]|uniref:hypothetical protein n=1 Tax=Plantactinospora sp. CA-290183 TaxID=3240006 RepID=UPI003D93AFEF
MLRSIRPRGWSSLAVASCAVTLWPLRRRLKSAAADDGVEVVWEVTEQFRATIPRGELLNAVAADDGADRVTLADLEGSAGGELDAVLALREHRSASIGVRGRAVLDARYRPSIARQRSVSDRDGR